MKSFLSVAVLILSFLAFSLESSAILCKNIRGLSSSSLKLMGKPEIKTFLNEISSHDYEVSRELVSELQNIFPFTETGRPGYFSKESHPLGTVQAKPVNLKDLETGMIWSDTLNGSHSPHVVSAKFIQFLISIGRGKNLPLFTAKEVKQTVARIKQELHVNNSARLLELEAFYNGAVSLELKGYAESSERFFIVEPVRESTEPTLKKSRIVEKGDFKKGFKDKFPIKINALNSSSYIEVKGVRWQKAFDVSDRFKAEGQTNSVTGFQYKVEGREVILKKGDHYLKADSYLGQASTMGLRGFPLHEVHNPNALGLVHFVVIGNKLIAIPNGTENIEIFAH